MFDIETFLTQLFNYIPAELNTQITDINTKKNDSFVIESIDPNFWLFLSLNDRVKNYKNFGFLHLTNVNTLTEGNRLANTYTVEIDLFIFKSNNDNKINRQVLRYWHTLRKAVINSWGVIGVGYDRPTITNLNPIDVSLFGKSTTHVVLGIELEFTIHE